MTNPSAMAGFLRSPAHAEPAEKMWRKIDNGSKGDLEVLVIVGVAIVHWPES
jgi:hypothetical protein